MPRGSKEEWESSLVEKVLVGTVSNVEDYHTFIQNGYYRIPVDHLKRSWQEAKYVVLYTTLNVGNQNGIAEYGKVERISTEGGALSFYVKTWRPNRQVIKSMKYGISTYI